MGMQTTSTNLTPGTKVTVIHETGMVETATVVLSVPFMGKVDLRMDDGTTYVAPAFRVQAV